MKKLKITALVSFTGLVLFAILAMRQYFSFHSEFHGKDVPVEALIRGMDPVVTLFTIAGFLAFVFGSTLLVWLIVALKSRFGKKSKQLTFASHG